MKNTEMRRIFFAVLIVLGLSSPAIADWREEIGSFRIGIVDNARTGASQADVEPFRLAVQESLGVSVEIIPFPSLPRLVRAHAEGRVEYAGYPATSFAASWLICECVEPLAVARAGDATSGIHSIVLVRSGSEITSPDQLIGRKIWGLRVSAVAGFAFAVQQLRQNGTDISPENTEFLFEDEPRFALAKFAEGEGDALIGWSSLQGDLSTGYSRGTIRQLLELGEQSASGYRVLWKSAQLPHRIHAIRKNLDGEIKQIMRDLLMRLYDDDPVAYDSIEPIYGGGFAPISQSALQPAIDFARAPVPGSDPSAPELPDAPVERDVEDKTDTEEGESAGD